MPRTPGDLQANVAAPKPFVKWVGGKRQLLPEILKHVPPKFGTYHEPFVGGGALFFALQPPKAVLSDLNDRLVRTYLGIRDQVEDVIELLAAYKHDKQSFLRIRRKQVDGESNAVVAAWFLYLNRTAYNGLYRVNSRNEFNVPFGDYAKPRICRPEVLRSCAQALRHAQVRHESFEAVEKRAKKGDFVYFDPPYVPLSATSYFTSYTSRGFGPTEQEKLRDLMLRLKKRGVHVLQSNSSAPAVRELYRDHFELIEVKASRQVNAQVSGRGKVTELLIR